MLLTAKYIVLSVSFASRYGAGAIRSEGMVITEANKGRRIIKCDVMNVLWADR